MALDESQLMKLQNYLIKNSDELVRQNPITFIPHYPDRDELRDYRWTIINIPKVGVIEMYNTSASSKLKIDGNYIDYEIVREVKFFEAEHALIAANSEMNKEITSNKIDKLG